jgi:deoxyhypusine synthase
VLNDPSRGGHDYFLQLTTDAPHWGGLSGATPSEARSWGKVKDARRDNVVVYSCASISLPLIARYVLTRNKPRRHRRLMGRLDELTEELTRSARKTTVFRVGQSGIRNFADVWEHAPDKSDG